MRRLLSSAITVGLLAVGSTGCATKKYVTAKVTPVEQRVSTLEKRTTDQGTSIEDLEKDQSKTRERLSDLDAGVKAASASAQEAGSRATQAANAAQTAQTQAADARKYAETRSETLERYIDARDQFKLARTENVLFAYGKDTLDTDAKSTIDGVARDLKSSQRFIIEVEGFTDSTGSPLRNISLSQRRAEAVARYLTTVHQIPIRSLHLIGVGSETPMAENNSEKGRKQNRRVEIRLFAPTAEKSSAVTAVQLR